MEYRSGAHPLGQTTNGEIRLSGMPGDGVSQRRVVDSASSSSNPPSIHENESKDQSENLLRKPKILKTAGTSKTFRREKGEGSQHYPPKHPGAALTSSGSHS
jgi:hypothetical protein